MFRILLLYICILLTFNACRGQNAAGVLTGQNVKQLVLSEKLREISGIAFSKDGRLFAHQDEQAIVFQLDPQTGRILKSFYLGDTLQGDFEDIEIVNDTFYLVKSNGDILAFREGEQGKQVSYTLYKTFLSRENNVEGLSYDAKSHSLLLALKGRPGYGLSEEFKTVYSFSLDSKKLNEKPTCVFDSHKIKSFSTEEAFSPSAIAFNSANGWLYVLAAKGNLLAVINSSGEVQTIYQLDRARHKQPEGLAFYKGNLFIADEGDIAGTLTVYPFQINK